MIKGSRLILRAVETDDLPRYVAWLNDPEVTRHLLYHPPFNLDDEIAWYQQQKQDKTSLHLAIIVSETNRHIGSVSLMRLNHRDQQAELGIVIGDKTAWGQSFGREAITLLIKYGFTELNLHRIYLHVDAGHAAAIRCYTACGFIQEGHLRQAVYHHGYFEDQLIMSILRPEFLEKQEV